MNALNQTIIAYFEQACQKVSKQVCLQEKKDSGWERWTYAQLKELSLGVANFLIGQSLNKGDFVGLLLENRPEWPAIYLGILYAGLACVPLDAQMNLAGIENLARDSGFRILFVSLTIFQEKKIDQLKENFTRIVLLDAEIEDGNLTGFSKIQSTPWQNKSLPEISSADVASLIYTSGTTGKPKGVLLTHANFCSNCLSLEKTNLVRHTDNFLALLPLHHAYAFTATLLLPLFLGAKVTYCPTFKSEGLSQLMREAGVTILVGVPLLFSLLHKSILARLKKIPFLLRLLLSAYIRIKLQGSFGRKLRYLISGGARLEPEIARDLCALGFKIIEGYGLTEASPVVALNPAKGQKFGSAGKAIPGVQVRIISADKQTAGQVLIKGPNVMRGYFGQPELTAQTVKDGWLYTQDLGYLDEDGFLFLTGRKEELLVLASGKNIYPEELEAYYQQSPYIKEMCIILRQEKIFGLLKDSLYAVIVPDEEFFRQKKELNIYSKIRWELENLSGKLPAHKHIMGFTLTKTELPRTTLKKLKRWQVRQDYLLGKPEGMNSEEKLISLEELALLNLDITKKVIAYLSKEIDKPVSLDSHLEIELGIDSLSRVELGLGLEALFKIKIADDLLYGISNVKELVLNLRKIIGDRPESTPEGQERSWDEILREDPPKNLQQKIKFEFGIVEIFFTWLLKGFFLIIFRLFWFLRIEGREYLSVEGPYLVCSNHASYLDGLFIFSSLPFRVSMESYFLGYQRIFEHPLLAWANRFCRMLSIDTNAHLAGALQAVSFVISRKKIVCIFPEGQRSINAEVKEFKKGVGILIKELGIPVIPVYIEGSHCSWPRGASFPRPYPIRVIFGRPFNFTELKTKGFALGAKDDYEAAAIALREEVIRLKKDDLSGSCHKGKPACRKNS